MRTFLKTKNTQIHSLQIVPSGSRSKNVFLNLKYGVFVYKSNHNWGLKVPRLLSPAYNAFELKCCKKKLKW